MQLQWEEMPHHPIPRLKARLRGPIQVGMQKRFESSQVWMHSLSRSALTGVRLTLLGASVRDKLN